MSNETELSATYQAEEGKDGSIDSCSSCASSSKIAGSFKPYDRHVIVCNIGDVLDWPSKIQENSLVNMILQVMESIKEQNSSSLNVTFTASKIDDEEARPRIILFPESIIITFEPNVESLQKVATFVYTGVIMEENNAFFQSSPVPFGKIILVCCHASRDKRCGRAGPQVIEVLKTAMSERGISENDLCVLPSSHIGGHEFAGTLIVYPEANWYCTVNYIQMLGLYL